MGGNTLRWTITLHVSCLLVAAQRPTANIFITYSSQRLQSGTKVIVRPLSDLEVTTSRPAYITAITGASREEALGAANGTTANRSLFEPMTMSSDGYWYIETSRSIRKQHLLCLVLTFNDECGDCGNYLFGSLKYIPTASEMTYCAISPIDDTLDCKDVPLELGYSGFGYKFYEGVSLTFTDNPTSPQDNATTAGPQNTTELDGTTTTVTYATDYTTAVTAQTDTSAVTQDTSASTGTVEAQQLTQKPLSATTDEGDLRIVIYILGPLVAMLVTVFIILIILRVTTGQWCTVPTNQDTSAGNRSHPACPSEQGDTCINLQGSTYSQACLPTIQNTQPTRELYYNHPVRYSQSRDPVDTSSQRPQRPPMSRPLPQAPDILQTPVGQENQAFSHGNALKAENIPEETPYDYATTVVHT